MIVTQLKYLLLSMLKMTTRLAYVMRLNPRDAIYDKTNFIRYTLFVTLQDYLNSKIIFKQHTNSNSNLHVTPNDNSKLHEQQNNLFS